LTRVEADGYDRSDGATFGESSQATDIVYAHAFAIDGDAQHAQLAECARKALWLALSRRVGLAVPLVAR
jgi:hypothetical protein